MEFYRPVTSKRSPPVFHAGKNRYINIQNYNNLLMIITINPSGDWLKLVTIYKANVALQNACAGFSVIGCS
jgi:hypothetical protein